LEARIALHGGPVRAAVQIHPVATDPNAAASQVLNTIATTLGQYDALQVNLDALAAKLQNESRSARQADANHAQSLVKRFFKQENKRYKQVVALAATVSGSPVFTPVFQLDQSIHQNLLVFKAQIVPTFRLLVGATFSPAKTSSPAIAQDTANMSRAAGHVQSAKLRPADDTESSEAERLLAGLAVSLEALSGDTLKNIANAPNTSCAFTASRALHFVNALLDVIQGVYEALAPLTSTGFQDEFVATFNDVVMQYNAAVVHNNAILATHTVTTH
jgi:hypothetical protein